jgi:hypothetical protein
LLLLALVARLGDFQLHLVGVVDELLRAAPEHQGTATLEPRPTSQGCLLRLTQNEPDLVVERDRVANAERLIGGNDLLVFTVEHELVKLHTPTLLRVGAACLLRIGWPRATEVTTLATGKGNRNGPSSVYLVTGWSRILRLTAYGIQHCPVTSRTAGSNYQERQRAATPAEGTFANVRIYALADLGDRLALGVYLRREDAFADLEQFFRDQSDCAGLVHVVPIELDERVFSQN